MYLFRLVIIVFLTNKISAEIGSYKCTKITSLRANQPIFCTFKNFKSTTIFNQFISANIGSYIEVEGHRKNDFHPSKVGKITFENVTLKEIPTNIFSTFSNLRDLNLSNVRLETITRENFANTRNIITLNLSKNKLTYLGNMIFSELKILIDLDLSENMLSDFHEGAFDFCCTALRTLNLKSNKINQVRPSLFYSMNNLTLLDLSENKIVEIGDIIKKVKQKNSYFKNLDLSYNDIEFFNCQLQFNVNSLYLNFNHIKNVSMNTCNVSKIYASNNEIEELSINEHVVEVVAVNNKISQINVAENTKLIRLEIGGNYLNASFLKKIRDMDTLEVLDLSQNNLGPISLDTFAKIKDLTSLNLSDTRISNLEYGTFSHQVNLKTLDLSKNNLNHIDLSVFTSLRKLTSFHLSGNNLKQIDKFDEIKKFFPKLNLISFSNNSWSCSYLANIIQAFTLDQVEILYEKSLVHNSTNIMGIGCSKSTNPRSFIMDAQGNENLNSIITLSKSLYCEILDNSTNSTNLHGKLSEIISTVNLNSLTSESIKGDLSDLNLKLSSLQNTFLDLKSRTLDFQLAKISELAAINFTSDSPRAASEVRLLIQEISNITLERQQLSNDKLIHKLHELQFEIDKIKSKVEDNLGKCKVLAETSGKNERIIQESVKDVKGSSFLFESFMMFVGILVILNLVYKLVFYFRNNFVLRTRITKSTSENTLRTTFEQTL